MLRTMPTTFGTIGTKRVTQAQRPASSSQGSTLAILTLQRGKIWRGGLTQTYPTIGLLSSNATTRLILVGMKTRAAKYSHETRNRIG